MNTQTSCSRCEYWDLPESGKYDGIENLGRCKKVVMVWIASEWIAKGPSLCKRCVKSGYAGQMSFVNDGSDYYAELWTKAEFFCAHFQAKETANKKS
jgi:hypothetical protein